MSRLIVTVQERNSCASHCQRKLSSTPVSIWIFQVCTILAHFNTVRDLLPITLYTRPCVHFLEWGLLIYLFMCDCAPTLPLLFLFWLKIVLDYFNTFSLYPVGSQFQVERITSLNTFPFSTKLQSHTPVKGHMIRKLCQVLQLPSQPQHSYCSIFFLVSFPVILTYSDSLWLVFYNLFKTIWYLEEMIE